MTLDKKIMKREGERGNALFLILIAVALFAALSYAITQSGRGGGNVSTQTNLITAGQLTEEPADIRAAVARMVLSGTAITAIVVNPATTGAAADLFDGSVGGGATNVPPPVAACALATDAGCIGWSYTAAFSGATSAGIYIPGVGTGPIGSNAPAPTGSDAIAYLQGTNGLTSGVCSAINKGLGFTTLLPLVTAAVTWAGTAATAYAFAGNASTVTDSATDAGQLVGQDFACVNNTGAKYAYYGSIGDQ